LRFLFCLVLPIGKTTTSVAISKLKQNSSLPCNGWGFKSRRLHQKSTGFDLSIFYPLRKQWYIITRKRASHHRRCISSAAGCNSFRNDDIQNFVLMICTAFAVIYARVRIHTQTRRKHLFCSP